MTITIEQSIYQEGREEGRREAARMLLLRFGKKYLGSPGETVVRRINSIDDLDRLDRMSERSDTVGTWDELLETQ